MVRFSDMLGGNGDAEGARPATAPDPVPTDEIPEPEPEIEPEPEPEPAAVDDAAGLQTPEAVLDRLTQYATSARAADPLPEPAPEPTEDRPPEDRSTEIAAVGDDLLPHGKAESRKRRRK
jgi:hypothetical protein